MRSFPSQKGHALVACPTRVHVLRFSPYYRFVYQLYQFLEDLHPASGVLSSPDSAFLLFLSWLPRTIHL